MDSFFIFFFYNFPFIFRKKTKIKNHSPSEKESFRRREQVRWVVIKDNMCERFCAFE